MNNKLKRVLELFFEGKVLKRELFMFIGHRIADESGISLEDIPVQFRDDLLPWLEQRSLSVHIIAGLGEVFSKEERSAISAWLTIAKKDHQTAVEFSNTTRPETSN